MFIYLFFNELILSEYYLFSLKNIFIYFVNDILF